MRADPDGMGNTERIPLSPDKEIAQRLLADLIKEREQRKFGMTLVRQVQVEQSLEDWTSSLQANGIQDDRVRLITARVKKVVAACGLDSSKVEQFLLRLRTKEGRSIQTSNDYLQNVRQFSRWLVEQDRLPRCPLPVFGLET